MPEAASVTLSSQDQTRLTLEASLSAGEIVQLPDGRAGVYDSSSAAVAGDQVSPRTNGLFTVTKVTGVVILKGGDVWWDHSANNATYKRNNDRDFLLGTAQADAASADASVSVNLNSQGRYEIDIMRDPFVTAIVGTQALGGLALNNRGGSLNVVISSTNEAQKVDALSKASFSKDANAIVEFIFAVPSDGAGTVVDVSVGIASATHATDADSITQHLLMHLDANTADIRFQSKDGTTTVASTDSTIDYTEGGTNQVHVWFDLRSVGDPQVYVNGALVCDAAVFSQSAAASEFKLLMHVEKTASTDTYEFDLDRLRVRTSQQ